jgi:hypothetical protein
MLEVQKEPESWSPYLAGSLTGLLLIFSVWFTGKYVGASTTFVRTAGLIEKIFSPERVAQLDYFIKEVPKIDWQSMFVFGVLIGAFVSAVSSKSFRLQALPAMWEGRFGPSRIKRAVMAFVGGGIAMFGARLADG